MSVAVGTDYVLIGAAEDVPLLEGRSVVVGGRRIAVFRLPDGWAAVDAACPHRGGPLQDGIVADWCVTCPLHNRRYDLRGDDLARHEVIERDGVLWLRLS
jgi:nitrite reductase (NADH) small subunit